MNTIKADTKYWLEKVLLWKQETTLANIAKQLEACYDVTLYLQQLRDFMQGHVSNLATRRFYLLCMQGPGSGNGILCHFALGHWIVYNKYFKSEVQPYLFRQAYCVL